MMKDSMMIVAANKGIVVSVDLPEVCGIVAGEDDSETTLFNRQ